MATINIGLINSGLLPDGGGYFKGPRNFQSSPNVSYISIINGGGNLTASPSVYLDGHNTSTGLYVLCHYLDMVWDFRSLRFANFTAATVHLTISNWYPGNNYPSDAAGGFALVGQDDATRVSQHSNHSNFRRIYNGSQFSNPEFAPRINYSAIGGSGSTLNYTLNSYGLAYLNSVATKSALTGYCCLGLIFGGIVDGTAHNWVSGTNHQGAYFNAGSIDLIFESKVKVNVGNVWKDVTEVEVNVGDSWKTVADLKTNIGDSWKDT